MGQFSWFTQDTNHRIINGEKHEIFMVDNKGNYWREECYEGYGEFGGKDFYELLAEMNGLPSDRGAGIDLAFENNYTGENPNILYPTLCEYPPRYLGGIPKSDPNQGWVMEYDEDEEEYY